MASAATNIQNRSNEIVRLSNFLEQGSRNHRWGECGSLLQQMMEQCSYCVVHLASIDPTVSEGVVEYLRDVVRKIEKDLSVDEVVSDPSVDEGGQVATSPDE